MFNESESEKMSKLRLGKQGIDDIIRLLLVNVSDACRWQCGNRPADVSQLSHIQSTAYVNNATTNMHTHIHT